MAGAKTRKRTESLLAPKAARADAQAGTLDRGLAIVSVLSRATRPLSLTAIAEATSLDPSSAHRLLKTLVRLDYAFKDEKSKRYVPGPRALAPISFVHPLHELRRDAQGTMQELQRTSGLTIQLTVFVGDRRLVVDVRYGAERLVPFYDTNLTRPLHPSATGKLLLSTMAEADWQRLLGNEPYASFTALTITTRDGMRAELARTVERGYSRAIDEAIMGLTAIAAPIRNRDQVVIGCLAAYGPSQALRDTALDEAATATRQAADLMSFLAPSVQPLSGLLLADADYE